MDELFQIVGDTISKVLAHPIVQIVIWLTALYLVILWLAAAYWTYRDAHLRTRNALVPYLAAAGIVVMTPIAFLLALIAYRIVRPPETIAERRARDLEAYVFAAEVASLSCAQCGAAVGDDWMRCPACGNQLAIPCNACGGRIEPDWSVCAWCARDLEPFGEPSVEAPVLRRVPAPVEAAVDAVEPKRRGAIEGWHFDAGEPPSRAGGALARPAHR